MASPNFVSVNTRNPKLEKIRALFDNKETKEKYSRSISAYLLPRTDAHQSEYLAERDLRVQFISGFSGSNAFAIITLEKALLWTDGRYFIQAESELQPGWELMKEGDPNFSAPCDWLISNLSRSSLVAFDPQLYSYSNVRMLQRRLHAFNISVIPLQPNLVDILWTERPVETIRPVIALRKDEYGVETSDKLEELRKKLKAKKCSSTVVTALDDIAWLLNIRGSDIPYNPLVFSVLFITLDNIYWFVDKRKLSPEVIKHVGVSEIHEYNEACKWITHWYLERSSNKDDLSLIYIPDSVNYEIGSIFEYDHCVFGSSIIHLMKSVKNVVELSGSRQCHVIDSAAIVCFLNWLEKQVVEKHVTVAEEEAANVIHSLRLKMPGFMGLSFETIAAVNEHAALPHYKMTSETGQCKITSDSVLLIDSGGHYRTGTTDVTRTVAFGAMVNEEFKRHFTLVLKGHISTAKLIFPDSINGIRIDLLARQHLWKDGLDFGHGVGHGVGHFLNVHEGPAGIGFRCYSPDGALHEKMIVTIEPGFYRKGCYGIRTENCYEIIKAINLRSGDGNFLTFKTLTYVPIQKSLIQLDLLTEEEIKWINDYHSLCYEKVSKVLYEFGYEEAVKWLSEACAPLEPKI
uniref:Xaa-Pro aminopeptidase 1 n=1 Tax=Syphacia muris TaxID=451379 RepID=A0A0N5ARI2_9BILA